MHNDIPDLTNHEKRALIYIYEATQETGQEKPLTISQLVDRTGWRSKYYTRAWKKLQPKQLVKRTKDGNNTRLELTSNGKKAADLLMQLNEVML